MTDKKYSLNYFNKHGKVELCRLVLAAAKIDYEDNFIENLTDSGKEREKKIITPIYLNSLIKFSLP